MDNQDVARVLTQVSEILQILGESRLKVNAYDRPARAGTPLKLNSLPERLDLKDEHLRLAKEAGVRFAINADGHNINHFEYITYGVATAKRGWLEAADVINTLPLSQVISMLKGKAVRAHR